MEKDRMEKERLKKNRMEKPPCPAMIERWIDEPEVSGCIRAYMFRLDEGAGVLIIGGSRTHVGAFSRTGPGQDTMTVQFPGHKDGVISSQWSETLCRILGEPVSVECGIHFDSLSGNGIGLVVRICGEMLEEACHFFKTYESHGTSVV